MSTPEPAVVKLRTGAQVPEPLVRTTQLVLESLMNTNPIALYEAYEIARDPSHVPFGKTGDVLREMSVLADDGSMHGTARDVILASVKIDGLDIRLVSPCITEGEGS
jgi:hypothetical protein